MSVSAEPKSQLLSETPVVVNDFSLVVATANGTGSQTANLTILRAFFKMGIPVHGENIFPSNIQGLPTWYNIRVSFEGFIARREHSEILVAFNPRTLHEDVEALPPGGVCVYNSDLKGMPIREDITYYPLPVNVLIQDSGMKGKFKDYIANMVFVGALSFLIDIPLEAIEEALGFHFKQKQKLVDSNMNVVKAASDWCTDNLKKQDPYKVESMNQTEGLIMMTGNEAGALGAVFGGVSLAAWYPITPSTSFIDALKTFLATLRKDELGKPTYAVIQSEDELAAIGMTIGAGFAGARAVTATSGPGLSLMTEFAGLGYFAEVPIVVWDVQRVGPSTGLPTRTAQCDISFVYTMGHGDTKNVLLFPGSIEECFEMGYTAFDLADTLQTPVFVLSDLDLGMNNWMSKPFEYPSEPINRGKVLSAAEVNESFLRYKDVDGDGITYRTLPGNENPQAAYFARGTGHNEHADYSERSDDWLKNMTRLARKFDTARDLVPKPIIDAIEDADVGIIAIGSSQFAIDEARARLKKQDKSFSFLRPKALPINGEVRDFVAAHERLYVIELNRDGQFCRILQNEMPEMASKLISFAYMDGMPLTTEWVMSALINAEDNHG